MRWASRDGDTLLYARDRLEGRGGGVRTARVTIRLASSMLCATKSGLRWLDQEPVPAVYQGYNHATIKGYQTILTDMPVSSKAGTLFVSAEPH